MTVTYLIGWALLEAILESVSCRTRNMIFGGERGDNGWMDDLPMLLGFDWEWCKRFFKKRDYRKTGSVPETRYTPAKHPEPLNPRNPEFGNPPLAIRLAAPPRSFASSSIQDHPEMSVVTTNLFDLLSEEDPSAAPAVVPAAKSAAAPSKSKAVPSKNNNSNAKSNNQNKTNTRQPLKQQNGMCDQSGSWFRFFFDFGIGFLTLVVARGSTGPVPTHVKEEHHPDKTPRHRKPAHGREFDRKSGTGRRDDGYKKQAVGKGNWGEPGADELEGEKVKIQDETVYVNLHAWDWFVIVLQRKILKKLKCLKSL